ncbi:MAG: TonB-dependent receptor [Bacteroidales bacterium]|nr:TonB-dependent receptor [Bacteroidales bacterium]
MKRFLTAVVTILACIFAQSVSAQSGYQVKGTVVDETGPVIGATVMEAGTSTGTVTDFDGNFTLTVSGAGAAVEISCIGYATQSFRASEVPSTIVLKEDTEFLNEVVVIGYGTVKKSDMTGSIVAIRADEINRGAVTSPEQMLMGKVAGLLVTPASGQPGASGTIRIRGAASLIATNNPLIVIDGVPITDEGGSGMGNPLSTVNPNDIESYSILKDASAAAIYGSRASNGVIMITTKKGSAGKIKVNYNGSTSVKQNYQFFNMMTTDQFAPYVTENYPTAAPLLGYGGDNFHTDWQKEIYRLAISTDKNVSVYGGTKLPFRVSLGYNLDQATVKVGDSQRANLDISLSPKFLDDHLSINLNAKGIYQWGNWANGGAVTDALQFDPTKPTRFLSGPMEGVIWNWYGSSGDPNTMASPNPLSDLYEWVDRSHAMRSVGNFQVDYKIHGFEDLRLNLNLGYDVTKSEGYKYNVIGSRGAKASSPDLAEQWGNLNSNTVLEMYADYTHDFGWSNIDAMAGYSWQHNFYNSSGVKYRNVEPRWQEADIYSPFQENKKEYFLISFFGRVNYNILDKYLFTFTLREDASSRFSPKNRWGLFPSAAVAWNIKNEDFLKDVAAVDQLKLRFGWGRTGQQDLGLKYYYPYIAAYTESTSVNMLYDMGNGERYKTLTAKAYNPNLKWETTETINAGVDFAFFHERLSGSIEAYHRTTMDLLNEVSTPLGTNFSNMVIQNVGNILNKGVEINLNVVPIETKDWHWSLGGNVTFQDVRITKLSNFDDDYPGVPVGGTMLSNEGYSSLYKKGYAPFSFFTYQQVFDKDHNPIQNMLVDRDKDGKITENDRYLSGKSPNPWMFFGTNMRLSYKNWDFSFNGHGSIGNYALNKVRKGFASSYPILEQSAKGNIRNLNNDYLYPGWTDAMTTAQEQSDLWMENASFYKIDDVNLGYTFHFNKNWIKSMRVAASVQNVLTITKYSGLDPELTSLDGVDNNFIPRPRLYTVRLNINF